MSDSGWVLNSDPFVSEVVLDPAESRVRMGGGVISTDSARLVVSNATGGEFAICITPLTVDDLPGFEFKDIYNNQLGYIQMLPNGNFILSGKELSFGPPDSAGPGYRVLRVLN